jgi:hypothetical protein
LKSSFLTLAGAAGFVALLVIGVVALASSVGSGASAATPQGELNSPTAWGNLDCSGDGVTTRDNQALLREVLQQNPLSQTEPCPDIGDMVLIEGYGEIAWGSVDCSNDGVTTRDNQALLREVLQQNPLSQTEPCPDIGDMVMSGTPTPTPTPDPARTVQVAGVDTNTSGNTGSAVPSIEDCGTIGSVGGTLDVDLVVKGVPPFDAGSTTGGLAAYGLAVQYDPAVVNVTAKSADGFIWPDTPFDLGDGVPDSDGTFVNGWVTFSATPNGGDGVAARLTLTAVGAGTSELTLLSDSVDRTLNDAGNNIYSIASIENASVVVGGTCP